MCIVEYVNEDGWNDLELAYKSSTTHTWIAVGNTALGERNAILRYAVVTDERGLVWPVRRD